MTERSSERREAGLNVLWEQSKHFRECFVGAQQSKATNKPGLVSLHGVTFDCEVDTM